MTSSLSNHHLDKDGLCSVYSLQPSETNCSIREEINAVNELPDDATLHSVYSPFESETNVTTSDQFKPCLSMNQFNVSVYSAPKSETNVTMKQAFENCQDVANVVYSTYTLPPSETDVTMCDSYISAVPSETNVSMTDGFSPCHVLQHLRQNGTVNDTGMSELAKIVTEPASVESYLVHSVWENHEI